MLTPSRVITVTQVLASVLSALLTLECSLTVVVVHTRRAFKVLAITLALTLQSHFPMSLRMYHARAPAYSTTKLPGKFLITEAGRCSRWQSSPHVCWGLRCAGNQSKTHVESILKVVQLARHEAAGVDPQRMVHYDHVIGSQEIIVQESWRREGEGQRQLVL